MSAAAARKKRRHQERLEAKNRAALAGLVVDPTGAGVVAVDGVKAEVLDQTEAPGGDVDIEINGEVGGGGSGAAVERGVEAEEGQAETSSRRDGSLEEEGGEKPEAVAVEASAGAAEGEGERKPRVYSGGEGVITAQPTGDVPP
ncbi:unnamed protein product [Ectocarpus sp. 13 AM-2016]